MDFWDMSPASLGGRFDVVLNLGILYHLARPIEALQLTKAMARRSILLDTQVYPAREPVVMLQWEVPNDIGKVASPGIVAKPSKASIALMLKHIRVADYLEIPIRTLDTPGDYLEHRRASWLITV